MNNEIHIGKEIERVMRERKISVKEFADKIHCHRKNVYNIFTRKSIDIERLIQFSEILNYDFIHEIYFPEYQKKENRCTIIFDNGKFSVEQEKE